MGNAKWVRFQGSVKLQEQQMKNRGWRRMSFGSQLKIAVFGELYYLCWTFIPRIHLLNSWKLFGACDRFLGSHISVRLAGSCHDLGWVDGAPVGGLCVYVIWHVPVKLQTLRTYISWTWTSFRDSQVTSTPAGGYTKTLTSTASPWRIEATETHGLFRMTRC